MGEFRDYRLTITGAIFIIYLAIFLWAGAGWDKGPQYWFPDFVKDSDKNIGVFLSFLTLIIVTSFAGGFICVPFWVGIQRLRPECFVWVDIKRLVKSLEGSGLSCDSEVKEKEFKANYYAEFHLRMHRT